MRSRDYSIASTHAKPLKERALVALLLLAGITLLVLSQANHSSVAALRARLSTALQPALNVVVSPVASARGMVNDVREFFATYEENRTLKAQNDALRHWQSVAQALKAENDALRQLMHYAPVENVSYITARVLASSAGDFSQSLLLNVGSSDGVKPLQPVADAYGVIGRVVDVAPNSSRVLLLTDVMSRIPVVTSDTRQRAILAGTGQDLLRLNYVVAGAKLKLGEAVVTTQEGDLIPGGIPVGTLFRQDESGYLIKPIRALTQPEYVRVIQYRVGE